MHRNGHGDQLRCGRAFRRGDRQGRDRDRGERTVAGGFGAGEAIPALAAIAASSAAATATTGTGGGQLLARLLNHDVGIITGPHDPHHQVVAGGRGIEQQGRIEPQPAIHQLLAILHRHGHDLRIGSPRPGVSGAPLELPDTGSHSSGTRSLHTGAAEGCLRTLTTPPPPTAAPAPATTVTRGLGRGHHLPIAAGRQGGAHQAGKGGQGLERVATGEYRHMAEATATGAGASEQFVEVLALALAGELNEAQFGELGDLGAGAVVAQDLGEMLQQLQLVAARLHVDEIDHHHAADVAQLELAGDLHRRLAVGPEDRFPGVGGAGEGAGVDVDHREGLGGLDDHVAAGGQLHPGLERIADGGADPEVIEDLRGFVVGLHQHVGLVGAEESVDPGHGLGAVNDDAHQLGAEEIAQDAMDEVFIAVEQHRRTGGLGRLLDPLPLAQQRLQVVDQQLLGDALGLGAHQQTRPGGLDQHGEGPQAVALTLGVDAARDAHPLAVGLEHQEAAGQGEIAGEAGPLGAGGLLHHLHEHLLAGLKQLRDAGAAFLEAQGAQVGDVDEAVLLALADVHKGGVDARQHVFDGAEIDVADLVAALGHHELIDTFVREHCGDTQLLGDDDLLGHGKKCLARGSPVPARRKKSRAGQGAARGRAVGPSGQAETAHTASEEPPEGGACSHASARKTKKRSWRNASVRSAP